MLEEEYHTLIKGLLLMVTILTPILMSFWGKKQHNDIKLKFDEIGVSDDSDMV